MWLHPYNLLFVFSYVITWFLPPASEGWGKVIFSLCVSVHTSMGGGVPQPGHPGQVWMVGGGGTPVRSAWWWGKKGLDGGGYLGYCQQGLDGGVYLGYPRPSLDGWGYPEVPPWARSGCWGYLGYPPPWLDEVPPHHDWMGYPPLPSLDGVPPPPWLDGVLPHHDWMG